MPEELDPVESIEGSEPASAPDPPAVPEDWEKRFTYLYADFENFRRRMDRERETVRQRTQAELLAEILPVVEAAKKAVEAVRSLPTNDPVRKGVEMLERAIAGLLTEHGVRVVGKAGEPFRPEELEAVGETVPTAGAPDGHVAEVVQLGFAFPGGLLRPGKVIVARRPAKSPARSVAEEKPDSGSELTP